MQRHIVLWPWPLNLEPQEGFMLINIIDMAFKREAQFITQFAVCIDIVQS